MSHLSIPRLTNEQVKFMWSRIKKNGPNDCWIWLGGSRSGYGRMVINGHYYEITRIIFKIYYKKNPGKLFVLHRCDNPSCCNPKHLFLGTIQDNNVDRKNKNRSHRPIGRKNVKAKLTEKDVADIRKSSMKTVDLARKYSMSYQTIWMIRKKKIWKHIN